MNKETSDLCANAAERIGSAIAHVARAMTVGRSVGWAASDLKDAREALSAAMRDVTDAIGRLESEHSAEG